MMAEPAPRGAGFVIPTPRRVMAREGELYRLATIGAPRGLRGEVRLNLHTDNPEGRLAAGTEVATDPDIGTLRIAALTCREEKWFARFEGHPDRTAVEALVDTVLLAEGTEEPDAWYHAELKGLRAQRPSGETIGVVTGLEHYPAQDVRVIKETAGQRTRGPLVEANGPTVDIRGGRGVPAAAPVLLAAGG